MFSIPHYENHPIDLQLWANPAHQPGDELDLSNATNRNLTVQFLLDGNVVHTAAESDTPTIVQIGNAVRGVIVLRLDQTVWGQIYAGREYLIRVSAYGVQRLEQSLRVGPPDAGTKRSINGVGLYASPSKILEILGAIPGAIAETTRDLSDRWLGPNAQGYWTLTLDSAEKLYGLWVDNLHADSVLYSELATAADRAWAKVGNTVYYKGPEDLDEVPTETAFSRMVLTQLRYATAEVEEGTDRYFGQWLLFRETHNGLQSNRQLHAREYPIVVNEWFRIDAYANGRDLSRRYTEADVSSYAGASRDKIHVDAPTGIVTINQLLFDFDFDGNQGTPWYGHDRFPKGQKNIEITYVFGEASPPIRIQEATAKLAASRLLNYWERTMAQGQDGASLGCVNIRFADARPYLERWKSEAEEAIEHHRTHQIEPY